MQRMEMQFEEKLKNIREEFEQKFKLLARSQQQTAVAHDGVRVSTKGSCAAPDPSGEQTHTDVPNQCELYVEDDPPRLVAIGRVFEDGSTIHGVPLQPDWTRVVVDQVQDAAAPVPLPNTEVQLVGQATGTFLAWPKRLVMPLSARAKVMREPHVHDANIAEAEDDPISKLLIKLPRLKKHPIQLQWDIRVFGVDSSDVPLYISLPDALEIVGGNSMLNISVIQLWAMYIDKLSVEQAQAQVYGFIEPQSIQKSGNTQVQIQQYMQTWMSESGRDIYIAPYIDGYFVRKSQLPNPFLTQVLKTLELDEEYEGNVEATGEDFSVEPAESRRPFHALLDLGLIKTTNGNRVFGSLKGALDGGFDIPHNDKRFAGFDKDKKELDPEVHRKYIFDGHVASYMKTLMEDELEKHQSHFSDYIKRGLEPDGLEELYKKVHAAIRADPSIKKSEKQPPKEHKRYNLKKLTYEERKAKLVARLQALNFAVDGHDDDEDDD
uniref:60S ribosomal protein L5 n=1 Tax=Cajanus cajan TaxID=3821 RepID=A0A151RQ51_CAJCA|nr:60S ribosomal protein L5 [Cajanus cajan]